MKEAWGEGLVDTGSVDLPTICITRDDGIIRSAIIDQGWEEQVRTGTLRWPLR